MAEEEEHRQNGAALPETLDALAPIKPFMLAAFEERLSRLAFRLSRFSLSLSSSLSLSLSLSLFSTKIGLGKVHVDFDFSIRKYQEEISGNFAFFLFSKT